MELKPETALAPRRPPGLPVGAPSDPRGSPNNCMGW